MVNAIVEMLGKTTLEHRKAHARKGSQLGYALCLVVVIAHEDTEIVLRLNHRLEEIGMLGRRIKHLDPCLPGTRATRRRRWRCA